MEEYQTRGSSLELDFENEDVCRILEQHVKNTLGDSNASSVSAFKRDDNTGFFVAIWNDGTSRVQTVGKPVSLEGEK